MDKIFDPAALGAGGDRGLGTAEHADGLPPDRDGRATRAPNRAAPTTALDYPQPRRRALAAAPAVDSAAEEPASEAVK